MDIEVPWNQLAKYTSGNCTPAEEEEMEAWIQADPKHEQIVAEFEELWQQSSENEEWDTDAGWEEFKTKLNSKEESSLRLIKPPFEEYERVDQSRRNSHRWTVGTRVAAAVALLAVTLLSVYLYIDFLETSPQPEQALTMQEVVTEKGQRSKFILSDGTQVWLNGDSRMEIPSRFTDQRREVHLQGEAFFEVTSDADKPFMVHAGESVTQVLGTQFNLKAYPDEEVQIVVKEGKVAFGGREAEQQIPELREHEMAVLSDSNRTSIQKVENLEKYLDWTNDKLIFDDTPLHQVMQELERWYDIECTLEDPSLRTRTVTGSFQDESMTEVLNIISLSVGMTYEKNKRSITFSSEKNSQ